MHAAHELEQAINDYTEYKKALEEAGVMHNESVRKILDSGERTEFETGAVRDMREGKGRCDLLPMDTVSTYLDDDILMEIHNFMGSGDVDYLYRALWNFSDYWEESIQSGRHYTMLLEVSKHFEEGAKKYGDSNWQKGIPVRCYIDSAVRHYLKLRRGDQDEPHERAFCWNILCGIWTCEHKPELNEYGRVDE